MRRHLPCLKIQLMIPPFLALVLVGSWNAVQMRSISSLESSGTELRGKISAALAKVNSPQDPEPGKFDDISAKSPIDWKRMPATIAGFQEGREKSQLRAMIDFQQRLKNMTREELIAALDEIDMLDLSADDREELMATILEPLIKLDPQYALSRFVDQIESGSSAVGWQLAAAFGNWLKGDAAAASAWFDRQIADGKFESRTLDGRSEMRSKFEAELVESLMSSDLAAAARRIQAMPEDQRREILEQLSFSELDPAGRIAYAGLVRQLIPADEREGSFAHIASQLINDGGYGQVSEFLDSVQAGPGERAAAAKQAAINRLELLGLNGGIDRTEVDSLRSWLDKQAPSLTDKITGKALAEASQNGGDFDYAAASQLVIEYQQSTGSDDVLVAFLEGYSARSNLEVAQQLADLISDPKRREEILNGLK